MRPPCQVLIVDDHPLVRAGLRTVVCQVLPQAVIREAGSGAEAMALIRAEPPQLALLDVILPGESGLHLASQIRAMHPSTILLMVAGEADPGAVQNALAMGASGFVAKTQLVSCLAQALAVVMRGDTFLCTDSQSALSEAMDQLGSDRTPPGPEVLSPREREVLCHYARGLSTKGIAALLQLSPKTVETHHQHIARKLGIDNLASLTHYAIRHGLVAL